MLDVSVEYFATSGLQGLLIVVLMVVAVKRFQAPRDWLVLLVEFAVVSNDVRAAVIGRHSGLRCMAELTT